MTDNLGYLLWWKVGEVNLDHDQLEQALAGTDIPLPARPIPHDVFRRITGSASAKFDLADADAGDTLELTLVPIDSRSDKMLLRHLVGTHKSQTGTPRVVRKVGDVAFYYPPRGKNSKARMRVTLVPSIIEQWQQGVTEFAEHLRQAYAQGVKGVLDGQAIRRLIRAHLAKHKALYLDGPYFLQDKDLGEVTAPLVTLFEALGEDSYMHHVPLPDRHRDKEYLARGLERAVKKGEEIDETIWKLVE